MVTETRYYAQLTVIDDIIRGYSIGDQWEDQSDCIN